MSRWANKINEFERADKRFRHLEGWEPQHSAAIKFLKTNPTKHQLLAHIKKRVDQVAKNAKSIKKNAKSIKPVAKLVDEDLTDLRSIVLDAQEDLRIPDNYIYKLTDLMLMIEDFLVGDPWGKSAFEKFHTAHKKVTAKRSKVDDKVSLLAKKWKIRLTKDINGKRVKRTESELKKLITKKEKACKARHGKNHRYCNK